MNFYEIKFNKNLIEPEEDKQVLVYLSDFVYSGPNKLYWVLFYHRKEHRFYHDGKPSFSIGEIGGWIYTEQILPYLE